MSYKLRFRSLALKEWRKLDESIKSQFKARLETRLKSPRVASTKLNGMKNCYKITLKASGYRLVYEVRDDEIVVSVVAVGKRERNSVYKSAVKRI